MKRQLYYVGCSPLWDSWVETKELEVLRGLSLHSGVIPGIVIDPCVVHEEVGKRNLLAGALVVIYVFDYRWQDPKITPKYLSPVLKLSFWKSTAEVIGGKVQSSREMSCELSLRWKLILSVSFCPYSERRGWGRRRQGGWLNRILRAGG